MTISTQPIFGVGSAGLPQSGVPQQGRVDSTASATKQASSFSAEEASDVPVPVKNNASVHNSTGTKTMELMDPNSQDKLVCIVDDQLPPLLSLIIDGLPPIQQSEYVHKAEILLHQNTMRYPNATLLKPYYRTGLSSASYMHRGVSSVDRLVAISMQYGYMFLVDDLFFDDPSELLQDQCGVSRSICESPSKIREYLDHLNAVFGQKVQPIDPSPLIETLMWELGKDMLELSNPEWFENFVASVVEHHRASAASHADIVQGHSLWHRDLESYAVMRAGNVGGLLIQFFLEFANDTYIPITWRATPYLENVTIATSIHLGFANDIFSYHKESKIEQNPRNLITMLLESERKPFVKTAHMAISVVNAYARTIVQLGDEASNSALKNYMQEIKNLIAGNVYFSYMDKRYRQPDSCFPELRDTTTSWKIAPDAEGLGL